MNSKKRRITDLSLLFLIASHLLALQLLVGCASRPEALPNDYKDALPFGAVDMNFSKRTDNSIFHSLGSALQQLDRFADKNHSFNILALSGGGSRGAFGTGFLDGWFESQRMPNFDIVTGVSTGAIMAPFIFLQDPKQMEHIKYFYTHIKTNEVFQQDWLRIFGGGHVANAKPLKKLLDEVMDGAFIENVAQQHKLGHRLYIGTTNLDTGKFVVWDMGAIAASHRSDKIERFKQIILASSALPAYVPPQYIDVEVDSHTYFQMHVDGGVYNQIFIVGLMQDWQKVLHLRELESARVTLYLVANRKYRQRDYYEPVKQNLVDIIKAYVLTQMDLLFDKSIYRIYQSARAKGYDFKLIAIPDGMKPIIEKPTTFEPTLMKELFMMGYTLGLNPTFKEEIRIDEYDRL